MDYQVIKLLDLIESPVTFGSAAGYLTLSVLQIKADAAAKVIEISMKGVKAVDVCFTRNSIAAFAKLLLGNTGVIISDIENVDVLDNLLYGMKAKSVPLFIKQSNGSIVIYSDLSKSYKTILSYIYGNSEVYSSQVVKLFDISAPNASGKLQKLHKAGLVNAEKRDDPTGGMMYAYSPIVECSTLTIKPMD